MSLEPPREQTNPRTLTVKRNLSVVDPESLELERRRNCQHNELSTSCRHVM